MFWAHFIWLTCLTVRNLAALHGCSADTLFIRSLLAALSDPTACCSDTQCSAPSWLTGSVFLQTSIQTEGFRSLAEGEPVEYYLEAGDDGRTKAVQVTGPAGAPPQVIFQLQCTLLCLRVIFIVSSASRCTIFTCCDCPVRQQSW